MGVQTRNQKRNRELCDDDALKIDDDFTNVSLVKKKKLEKSHDGNGVPSDSDHNVYDNLSFITEKPDCETTQESSSNQTESDEFYSDETYEKETTIGNNAKDENENNKVFNLKLKSSHVQQIIKESVKQLVKRFKDDDMEFLESIHDDDEYEKFMSYIDKIHNGDFFERIPIEERKRRMKNVYSVDDIKRFNDELENLHKMYKEEAPSIIDILKMNVHNSHKQKLLEKVHQYSNAEVLTSDYNTNLKYLLTNINKTQEPELFNLEQEIIKCAQADELSEDYRKKILKSKMSFENKVIAYKRLEIMERYEDSDSSEFAKYKNWMDTLLAVPFGKYINVPCFSKVSSEEVQMYIARVRNVLDQRLSFLEKPKDQIINLVTQMVRNSDTPLNAIGLYGCKGVGKTSIVKSIAEALDRPYRTISLGGESDTSLLTGHGFTYVGSTPGRLIEILNETKSMNPVVLVDELDKVSQTHHGKEIIGTLIHLTDTTTNFKYNYDRYFAGIEFDLSKVLFVFTYNDPSKVDKILADRLFKIKVDNYSIKEKLEITQKHLISNILDQYKFTNEQIKFDNEAINYIISTSKNDEGMRDIKRKFEIIISRINTLVLTKQEENIVKLKYKSLYQYYSQFPVLVLKEHVDIFLSESTSNDTIDNAPPPGMYM